MIPSSLKINNQALSSGDFTSTMPFPGLPEWKLGTIAKWPLVVHVWFHEKSGWAPVMVDVFNSASKGWLKGQADEFHFDLPSLTGRSFGETARVLDAFGVDPKVGWGDAGAQFYAGLNQPEQNLTYITGSGNMRFWQPERAWVEWYGKTWAAVQWFAAYREQDVLRPRWNLAPNGMPARKSVPGFNEWDQANGLNAWDSQHLDAQEECAAVVLFRSAPHMMAAVNLWNSVRANSKSLAMVDGQEYTGSSRVPGWYFTFAAQLLEAIRACEKHVALDVLRDEILADVLWHLANCLKIHPMVNPWYYGSFPAVKAEKKDYWVPYQFAVKWWGCLSLVKEMRAMAAMPSDGSAPHTDENIRTLEADAASLANRIHKHLVSCWLPDHQAFAYYMTVDRTMSEPMTVPGVASWMGPPSMLAKELGLDSSWEFETVVVQNTSYFGLDPKKASAVNLLRPVVEKAMASEGKK